MSEQDWPRWAACKDINPEQAFSKKYKEQHEFAHSVCGKPCPVKAECLTWALATEEGLSAGARRARGVLGGWTGTERHRIAAGQTAECADCGVMIVPLTWTHLRCEVCGPQHKARENAARLLQFRLAHGTRAGYQMHRQAGEDACEPCRAAVRRPATEQVEQLRPCGTRSGFERHKANGEQPCPNCVAANRKYFADGQRRRRKRAAA